MPAAKEKCVKIPIHEPDLKEKLFFFISGIIISTPFAIVSESLANSLTSVTSRLFAVLWATAIVAPLIEEFAKAYPLIYRHGETTKSIFTLGFLIGLGFGVTEFFIYVFLYNAPIIIRLPGVLFHAASTSIVAYGIAKNKFINYYLIAVLLHFSNNFSALLGDFWLIGGLGATFIAYVLSLKIYRNITKSS